MADSDYRHRRELGSWLAGITTTFSTLIVLVNHPVVGAFGYFVALLEFALIV